jgi:hypothetical protein
MAIANVVEQQYVRLVGVDIYVFGFDNLSGRLLEFGMVERNGGLPMAMNSQCTVRYVSFWGSVKVVGPDIGL